MTKALTQLARSRIVIFLAVGAVLAALAPRDHDARKIVVEEARILDAVRATEAKLGRHATPEEKHSAILDLVDDEVLAREALRLGLGTADEVVRTRLAERMRASMTGALPRPLVTDRELDLAIAEERARAPERVRLAVWFVSKERRDAQAMADEIARAVAEDATRARGKGDRPPIPDGATWTEAALARVCGPAAARAAMTTPVGTASPAIAAAWGHFVFVPLERRAADPSEVRSDALERLVREKTAADLERSVTRARRAYEIDVHVPAGEPAFDPSAPPPPTRTSVD